MKPAAQQTLFLGLSLWVLAALLMSPKKHTHAAALPTQGLSNEGFRHRGQSASNGLAECIPSIFHSFDSAKSAVPWPFIACETENETERKGSDAAREKLSFCASLDSIGESGQRVNASMVSVEQGHLQMRIRQNQQANVTWIPAVTMDSEIDTGVLEWLLLPELNHFGLYTIVLAAENQTVELSVDLSDLNTVYLRSYGEISHFDEIPLEKPIPSPSKIKVNATHDMFYFSIDERTFQLERMSQMYTFGMYLSLGHSDDNWAISALLIDGTTLGVDDFRFVRYTDGMCTQSLSGCEESITDEMECSALGESAIVAKSIFTEPFYINKWSDEQLQFFDDMPLKIAVDNNAPNKYTTGKYEWNIRDTHAHYGITLAPVCGSGAVTSFGLYYYDSQKKIQAEMSLNVPGLKSSSVYVHLIHKNDTEMTFIESSISVGENFCGESRVSIEYTTSEILFSMDGNILSAIPFPAVFDGLHSILKPFVSVRVANSSALSWAGSYSSQLDRKYASFKDFSFISSKCDEEDEEYVSCDSALIDMDRLSLFLVLVIIIMCIFSCRYIKNLGMRYCPDLALWRWIETMEEGEQPIEPLFESELDEFVDEEVDFHALIQYVINGDRSARIHTGLSQQAIDALPVLKWDPDVHKLNDSCCICLDDFSADTDIRLLPCNHIFHPRCVDMWFATKTECPICKSIVPRYPQTRSRETGASSNEPVVATPNAQLQMSGSAPQSEAQRQIAAGSILTDNQDW